MLTRGAEWRRWEPHIHAPGTVLNDQFGGPDPWAGYLSALESRSPRIEAIGFTDYYVTDTYEQAVAHRAAGRLSDVKCVFPNIEVRLDIAAKSGFVNLHLLVSPEDPDHVAEAHRVLRRLQFNVLGDTFDCTREDLIRLGRRADPSLVDDRRALAHGATQFKVNFDQLKKVLKENEWARENILVGVAGGAGDGTSGLRQAADATIRQEIERFAHIIFASSPSQREFWLGGRALSIEQLRDGYDGCKPCLHGSDAHDEATVGMPDGDRYCWIKGALSFDALRQACIDPGTRAFVGTEPPGAALSSQVISRVEIRDAPWAATPDLPLNPGLVAIIGARGSGKTALADTIAAGCDAIPAKAWEAVGGVSASFLARARDVIGDAKVALEWGGGDASVTRLDGGDPVDPFAFQRARYLSQQFVEELCSASGASEGLVSEIERVIFEAHPRDDRDGAVSFAQLRERRTERFRQARRREVEAIDALSERIADEFEKEGMVAALTAQASHKRTLIAGYTVDLGKLVVKGTEAQAARHAELNVAVQRKTSQVQAFSNQRRLFVSLQDEVRSTRASKAPEMLRQTQARHPNSGLDAAKWDDFLLVYKGDVDKALLGYIEWADREIAALYGTPPTPAPDGVDLPYVADGADLASVPLAVLKAEMTRLERLISADQVVRGRYAALAARITQENSELQGIEARLLDAQGAGERRKQLQGERENSYGRVFQAIIGEQCALADLYAPLMTRLAASEGTLRRLGFSVARVVDAAGWGGVAEDRLIDCRRAGPFYGRGSLIRVAETELRPAWEAGDAASVQAAMSGFVANYAQAILAHAPVVPTQPVEFRAWSRDFSHWLFGTDHISVRYEITYDGVDIRKLSPGTRGIVLLLLYLALDDADDRPLIIDQPEENLDPKSVFDELVSLFIAAKAKRQVIMVTHNANLVINTDADQVIIAECGHHAAGGLPPITYQSGGLEDQPIRDAVCSILEGGADAFRERARRLRVRLSR
ncbi:TrlF family AAA-like ATPase [Sphingomonas corticis]|uniref:ATP-binding protein n=1 Tax=Sphingomonas corticis TaxID=2722791 RepID=A0ABX1CRA2_9SPHN|nr:ATP-binding protein [Sphingomonas corticis]